MRRFLLHIQHALFPLAVVAFSLYYLASTWDFPWRVQAYGFCVAGLALLLSAILLAMSSARESEDAPPFRWVVLVAGLSVIFAVALPVVGYVPCVVMLTAGGCVLWGRFGLGGVVSETPWRDAAKGLALGCLFAVIAYGMVLTSQASLAAFPWS